MKYKAEVKECSKFSKDKKKLIVRE